MTATSPNTEESLDHTRAPLLEHLIELRSRLIKSLIALVIGALICYVFAENIYAFLVQPLADQLGENRRMIFTALHETFFTYLRVALFGGIILAFPVIAFQAWMFIAPGLYRNERHAFLPFLAASPVLFAAGASLVYFLIMPLAIQFFVGFESPDSALPIQLEAKVSEYLNLVMLLMLAFGLCFQLPVALTLMARVGLIDSAFLKKHRKYAIILVFITAAVLTPPDPISQLGLGIPVLLLYELSIWAVRVVEKRQAEAKGEG